MVGAGSAAAPLVGPTRFEISAILSSIVFHATSLKRAVPHTAAAVLRELTVSRWIRLTALLSRPIQPQPPIQLLFLIIDPFTGPEADAKFQVLTLRADVHGRRLADGCGSARVSFNNHRAVAAEFADESVDLAGGMAGVDRVFENRIPTPHALGPSPGFTICGQVVLTITLHRVGGKHLCRPSL